MPSVISPQFQDKASGFFSSSGVKLKEAGTLAGELAKDVKESVADVAERLGSMFKNRWSLIQKPSTRHAVQESLISAVASTGTILRKGVEETKDKVSVGKMKAGEVAKKTAQRSKTILTDIERWQKGVASTDVFGVPIEATVQHQRTSKPIPHILIKCADTLIVSGLNAQYLFKDEGNKKAIQQLVSLYNQDSNASLPDGVNPVDVAALVKCYLASLPEPLATFNLYNEIKGSRSSIHLMRNILKKLSNVNYTTLEFITALLLLVSQKSPVNKMDARSIAVEMAPVIMWQKGMRPESYRHLWNQPFGSLSKKKLDDASYTCNELDMLSEESETIDAATAISLDDGLSMDYAAIEALQCLIEHHNAIFTDANETIWR